MPKFAANLTMLFNEQPFLDRFGAAARNGFKGVEFLFPYEFEPQQVHEQLEKHKLDMVLHNLPAGNWAGGERGIACHPNRIPEFEQGVETALAYASVLGTQRINCLAGIKPQGVADSDARATLVSNLKFAATALKKAGIPLLIEPINTFDIPGFFLSGTRQGLELIESVGSDNLFLQYDIYHMQRMEGELANTIKNHLSVIKHVQLADNPGRFEPGSGEINYRFLLNFLDEAGYEGWVGCEYKPKSGTEAGLGWREELTA
ncbi:MULTISPECIES: hydroxypyruvate isomerase [unclassified Duganella]|uniref:hydroxypyruvate isomerase n=1 Tax=unclassified Duganella TaxID=2636909 RepID=UPI0006FF3847|nr:MULTISPECIES: hydroxypyruvate isomerase [unclassified Duganella]KQV61669.1 hydroxypyruvate isomerase [Duganella sp. Root336D2]KRB84177.1 hydroxypyruvate isomerase [Duganella sp. Root198D2]